MRYLRGIGLPSLVLTTYISASPQDDSSAPSSLVVPPDRYHDVILPQVYAALSKVQQLNGSDPVVNQGFNGSSFYLPPSLGIESLEFTQNGTAIRVPLNFWRSALELDDYPTPEAIKFSFEEFPLNPRTAAFHGESR